MVDSSVKRNPRRMAINKVSQICFEVNNELVSCHQVFQYIYNIDGLLRQLAKSGYGTKMADLYMGAIYSI